MAKSRRSFTKEYKIQAVKLIKEKGLSISEAARQLGVDPKMIRDWRKQLDRDGELAFPGHGNPFELDELTRLRQENKRLLMECEILKKAAAFFAKESM